MIKEAGKSAFKFVHKNAPTILAVAGATGVILTAVATGKATLKAKKALDKLPEDADIKDKAKVVAPIMAKPFLLGAATIFCILEGDHIHVRRNAALAACYTISSKALDEYSEKVIETIGKKKEQGIRDAIAEDAVGKNTPPEGLINNLESEKTICLDKWSGRYFVAKIEEVDKAINEVNYIINSDGFAALNEFYERIGLEPVENGEDIGWSACYDGLVNVERSSQLYNDSVPILVLTFSVKPREYYTE